MIKGFIIRAGNQADVQEKLCASVVGGVVSRAKSDILARVLLVADSDEDSNLSVLAWGHFCPFARDRLKALVFETKAQVHGCLLDNSVLYEKLLHREILASNIPMKSKFTAWTPDVLQHFTSIEIEGKTVDDYLSDIINLHGRRILAACESSVVQQISINEFVVRVGSLIDSEMEQMKRAVELCFSSFCAEWLREINTQIVDSALSLEKA